jgi:PAS domain S-box-containing protein
MQNAELSRAHAEAAASAEKLSDLYDFAPLGYVTLDDAARIGELNLTAAKLLGKPRAQLVGTPFVNWVARRDGDALRRHLQTALATESEVTGEVDLCVEGGRVVPVQLCTIYRRPESGQKPHYRTALTDITEL